MAKAKNPKNNGQEVTVTSAEATLSVEATEEKKNNKKRSTRKPAIVRTEPRANLVPISLEEEIRELAYLLSERRGFEPGHETDDWLAAEREVHERYHQHSA